ncbi:MAG: hypothetical protein HYT98_02040 [Candidatus Sungbacteria bacterium]|nr:hypothetical protein [Candidatus Sungbacteria bacterium]
MKLLVGLAWISSLTFSWGIGHSMAAGGPTGPSQAAILYGFIGMLTFGITAVLKYADKNSLHGSNQNE